MCRAITPVVLGLLSTTLTCLAAAQTPAAVQAPAAGQVPVAAQVAVAARVPAKSEAAMPQMLVPPTVHLNGAADLERLRRTNLYHYLRARKILAAANEICRPKPERTYRALFNDSDPHCGAMWMTSFPPKKQLTFRLDDVYYVALVTVTDLPGRLIKVHEPKR